ncbi:histidine phosphatase family protein [Leeia sp. TBRC 13508]|uniref:Histidine phosphatase family protein n=1 Tax=Leeia speluncae TaxID=2884804 RepID=A0ABS8D2Y2_9NEIS|nr:histidine phosphatase family protein [Leeia speluncae]MCB6182557.1 histidine phosphatase family protein [Leeia speluncae]
MPFTLIRHPKCVHAEGICYGHLDLPADSLYLKQHLPQLLAALPSDFLLMSSPSSRCQKLAEEIAREKSVSISTSELLRELYFGYWEGRAWESISVEELDAWAQDIWGYCPGDGESASSLKDRCLQFLAWMQQQPITKDIVVISHAGFIRMCLSLLGKISPDEQWTYPIAYMHPYLIEEFV